MTTKTYATATLYVAFVRATRRTWPFCPAFPCARSSTTSTSAPSPSSSSSPVPSAGRGRRARAATALYAGSDTSHSWTATQTTRNTVDSPKNANAERVAASASAAAACAAVIEGSAPRARTDASAESSCTPEIATATAAWPDIVACIAGGPKSAATATTAVCRYEPAAAWQTPLRSTKAKNAPAGGAAYVLSVSRRQRSASAPRERRTRREFEAYEVGDRREKRGHERDTNWEERAYVPSWRSRLRVRGKRNWPQ